MKKSEFHKIIDATLKPTLVKLGFEEVNLKDIMKPEVLYRKNTLWFGASWDWRDQYLELDLGHLYWFKDVIPRLIVVGDYSSYCNDLNKLKEAEQNYLINVASTVAQTLGKAISVYDDKYNEILSKRLNGKTKYAATFLNHLGNEATYEELSKYKA